MNRSELVSHVDAWIEVLSPGVQSPPPAGLSSLNTGLCYNLGYPTWTPATAAGGWGSPSSAVVSPSAPTQFLWTCQGVSEGFGHPCLGHCVLPVASWRWPGGRRQYGVGARGTLDTSGQGEPKSALMMFTSLCWCRSQDFCHICCLWWLHRQLPRAAPTDSVLILRYVLLSGLKSTLEADAEISILSPTVPWPGDPSEVTRAVPSDTDSTHHRSPSAFLLLRAALQGLCIFTANPVLRRSLCILRENSVVWNSFFGSSIDFAEWQPVSE